MFSDRIGAPTFKCSNAGKVMGKPFDIVEYGVCYIEDILAEIPESSLIVSNSLFLTAVKCTRFVTILPCCNT